MKLFRRGRKNNKGFTLVEVVCAVAIMGLATTAIGSAMIASTNNYQRGSVEVDLQKEAQTTTNLIGNLLVDAVEASVSADGKTIEIKGEGKEYKLVYDDTADTITYYEKLAGGSELDGCLAEDVAEFNVDLTKFATDKSAKVQLSIVKNGKSYDATYNTTARNGSANVVGAAAVANIIVEQEVILEPNQTYYFPITILGMSAADANVTWSSITADAGSGLGTNTKLIITDPAAGATINVDKEAYGSMSFSVSTKDSAGNVLDSKMIKVKVRSVEGIGFNPECSATDDNKFKAEAVYKINANAIGYHFERAIGKSYDDSSVNPIYAYKNPKYIQFDYKIYGSDGTELAKADYIDEMSRAEDVDNPYIQIKLKQDMPSGAEIQVIATSKHSVGTISGTKYNKLGSTYGTVSAVYEIKNDKGVIWPTSGMKRGDDYFIFGTSLNFDTIKSTAGGSHQPHWYFRYRDKTNNGGWTQYYMMAETGSNLKMNTSETRLFLPLIAYEFEIILAVIDETNDKVLWPYDSTLLSKGGFEGYTAGWDASKDPMTFAEYGNTFTLGAAELLYYDNSWDSEDNRNGLSTTSYSYNAGSPTDGIDVCKFDSTGASINSSQYYQVNVGGANVLGSNLYGTMSANFEANNLERQKHDYTIALWKYDGSSWDFISSDETYIESNYFAFQIEKGRFNINEIKGKGIAGNYRIGVIATAVASDCYKEVATGSVAAKITFSNLTGPWPLYTSNGYIYIDILEPTLVP